MRKAQLGSLFGDCTPRQRRPDMGTYTPKAARSFALKITEPTKLPETSRNHI